MRRLVPVVVLLVSACAAAAMPPPPPTGTISDEPAPAICEDYGPGTTTGTIGHAPLTETSGMVVGATGTLWAHNDSGSEPQIFAMSPDGSPSGVVEIDARNVDWEDLAPGPGPGGVPYLYVADIGDNLGRRRHVTLYRFPEPSPGIAVVTGVEVLDVTYPGGSADAETLVVDPVTGDAFIVTKTPGWGQIYEVPAASWGSGSVTAIDAGAVILPRADSVVTGGDVTRDGTLIALRTYGDLRLVPRDPGESIGAAMTQRSCFLAAVEENQGETVAFDGMAILTVGEGRGAAIHRYERTP